MGGHSIDWISLNLRNVQSCLAQSLITGLALIVLAGCSGLVRNPVPIEDIQNAGRTCLGWPAQPGFSG